MSAYRSVDRPDISPAAPPRLQPLPERPRLSGAAARTSARVAAEASRAAAGQARLASAMLRERQREVAAARARLLKLFEQVAPRLARAPGAFPAGAATRVPPPGGDASPPPGPDRRSPTQAKPDRPG
ncbi:hypothetical protein AB0J72_57645 [Dactylosporangium sp. NPDC049742]|uniref:hypothetical protein n=1 Tax=Dactylosporangium sp. NPDC049742 TaxID=3154737 RepID=UPI00342D45EE